MGKVKRCNLTREYVLSHFSYDESSKSCLVRSTDVWSGKHRTTLTLKKGDEVGSLKEGYWQVKMSQVPYFAHNLIWIIHFGEIDPQMDIDHIDRNPANNKISNLRQVPHKTNCQNRKVFKTSPTGIPGVNPTSCGTGMRARWKIGDKYFQKSFFGESALDLAIAHRNEMVKMMNRMGEGYIFTEEK